MRKDVGNTQGTAPLVCRAEDQEAGPVGAPEQWPPSPSQGLCGRRGAEAQQGHDIRILADIGEKSDIGPDIGNIGFGKERVCPDIVPISAPILPISGPISGKMTRYRVLVTRYRITQYRDTP